MENKIKLLFITQKIDEADDDLAFVTQWIDEMISIGYEMQVICLEKGQFDDRFPVYSLGKESGKGKFSRLFHFMKLVFTLKYNRVFVHMNPEYFTLAGWWWALNRIPSYLWYTHYTNHIHLRLAAFYSKRMFAATAQSLPQYEGNKKKIVTNHGINFSYWNSENKAVDDKAMLMVHRLSPSKRVELGIESLVYLPKEYTLTIYGRPIDEKYFSMLKELVAKNNLTERVVFKGPVPMPMLRSAYPNHKIMINMAPDTIDKTTLEAMCNGVFPVTTNGNLEAIGLSGRITDESPRAIAEFILSGKAHNHTQEELVSIVSSKHSLKKLILKLDEYIKNGN